MFSDNVYMSQWCMLIYFLYLLMLCVSVRELIFLPHIQIESNSLSKKYSNFDFSS